MGEFMKKFMALMFSLFSAAVLFAGFADDCKEVEAWTEQTYPVNSPSCRMQSNHLRQIQIRQSTDSEAQKCEKLRQQFPKALDFVGEAELQAAKEQGITFRADNKTLIRCPQNFERVVIPSSVTTIGDEAFLQCKNLTGVVIQANCTAGDIALPDSCQVIRR